VNRELDDEAGGLLVEGWSFNPPAHWPDPPRSWNPSASWQPDPAWGPVPPGWQLWVRHRSPSAVRVGKVLAVVAAVVAVGVIGVWIPRVDAAGLDMTGSVTGR
jgi:hypothetical protein